MSKISIVIPNYNGERFIEGCLEAIYCQEEGTPDFDIIIVDDRSTDTSVSIIGAKYPGVKVIINEKNIGFAGSVNRGITESDAEYVILLNNDTKVKPDFVKNLFLAIEKDANIFSVSSKMLMWDNEKLLDDAGDIFTIFGWARAIGKGKPASKYDKPASVFSACAGAAIYRKSLLEKTGLFDEEHFAYLEDLDIGYRAKILGFKNMYEPGAEVIHYGSASFGSRYSERKAYLSAKNNVYVIKKNMPLVQLIINLPFIIMGFLIKTFFYIKKGFAGSYLKGFWDGIKLNSHRSKVRIPFKFVNILNYFKIEFELLLDTLRLIFG